MLKFCKTLPMAVKLSTSQNGVSSAIEKVSIDKRAEN